MDVRITPADLAFMDEALRVAARIPSRPWPNPPVGAVVVADGRIVGRGAHLGKGTTHAEVVALAEAGPLARGATLYCTLEPCNHHGSTPPCTPHVIASGVRRVVIGVVDPNRRVRGGGVGSLRQAGLEVLLGVRGAEALDLIWPFAATQAFERPYVLLKTATSIDARFAPPVVPGRTPAPFYLTGLDARRDVQQLRRWCDVVLVGERTVRADNPRLDGRLLTENDACPAADPMPAYADTNLSLSGAWPDRAHWVFTSAERATTPPHGSELLVGCATRGQHLDAASIVTEFGRRGGRCLMVEGGPTLAASFLATGLVDRWVSYIAPVVQGDGVGWPPLPRIDTRLHPTACQRLGDDIRLIFDRLRFDERLRALTEPGSND